jgi:hypothetical protein
MAAAPELLGAHGVPLLGAAALAGAVGLGPVPGHGLGPVPPAVLPVAPHDPPCALQLVPDPPVAAGPDDVRTLAVRYNSAGFRQREYRDMLTLVSEDPWPDFPVRGPRTCRWVLQFMLEHGGTPRGWHQRWKADAKLQQTDAGVALHEVCCFILESMCTYDQLNAPNLASAEHAARQVQLVEERWKDRLIGSAENQDALVDMHLYSGQATRGTICVAPQLQEWISEELRKEFSVAKERRKAREERALTRTPKNEKGEKGGGK